VTDLLSRLRTASRGRGAGLSLEVRTELKARDVLLDRPVDTQQAGRGVARGIDEVGALLLERPGGELVRVLSGSVRAS
jgi:biotin-(acetyl-CoA carboxylase) ligase